MNASSLQGLPGPDTSSWKRLVRVLLFPASASSQKPFGVALPEREWFAARSCLRSDNATAADSLDSLDSMDLLDFLTAPECFASSRPEGALSALGCPRRPCRSVLPAPG
eukprot:CAMPEP_0204059616 /NCGR_PEP_ID=MMETSP0360-20130528/138243_1 /ASSEMBLY_ACC=CAM_ASM_000342 /TAXON_ID=268821 /ORGANISM="Scrippsiella Hangoei, Strain SHTV-5" /LENGTH=108 /DNA_ID=CAMNT_0051007233 /DNA_START=147 /DNA_END=470 /DNA_ORIENTATION=+